MSDNPTSGQIPTHRFESSSAPQIAECGIRCSPFIRAFAQPLTHGFLHQCVGHVSPTQAHTNTGRLCSAGSARHRVPRRLRSYAALRLPCPRRPPLRSSLANGLPRCGGLVLCRRTGASADRCNAGDISTPAPPLPALSRGESRVSQVPGPSSSCVPWSSTPPGAKRPSPALGAPAVAFKSPETLGTRNRSLSWLYISRPTRSRTYASPSPLPFPAQGSLPARAGSPLAGRDSHPLDDKQGFVESTHTPFLLDQPRLVAPSV